MEYQGNLRRLKTDLASSQALKTLVHFKLTPVSEDTTPPGFLSLPGAGCVEDEGVCVSVFVCVYV